MQTFSALLILVAFFLTSCVHAPEFRNENAPKITKRPKYNNPNKGKTFESKKDKSLMTEEMKVKGLDVTEKEAEDVEELPKPVIGTHDLLTVPPEGEPVVQKWVTYFQGRGREHMERYLERLGRYESYMTDILVSNGLPRELIYVALIESGFSTHAHSSASAVGYWQFIRGTGRAYDLKINALIDERKDPRRATEAASQYFKALYNVFGSWPLALASYNAGENRVMRAIMRNYSRDFWHLARTGQLPRETSNYVPKFIAAARICNHPKKYGFGEVQAMPSLTYDEVEITKSVSLASLAKNLGVSQAKIKKLNPAFRSDFVPIYRGNSIKLRVPEGYASQAVAAAKKSLSKRRTYAGSTYHRVRRGDSLYRIARRYGTSVSKLQRINGLYGRSVIRPGMKIRLPGSVSAASSSKKRPAYHKVRRGDNLTDIARRYGMSLSTLRRLNSLSGSRIYPGMKLKLSGSKRKYAKARYHRIRRGETLGGIARKYGIRLSSLAKANNMTVRTRVRAGAKIIIP